MRHLLVGLGLLLAVAGCQRPSQEACDKLCWRYAELQFWAAFEDQARDLAPEDRAILKAERTAEWEALRASPENRGRDNCIRACRKGGKKADLACVEAAETAVAARACMAE